MQAYSRVSIVEMFCGYIQKSQNLSMEAECERNFFTHLDPKTNLGYKIKINNSVKSEQVLVGNGIFSHFLYEAASLSSQ